MAIIGIDLGTTNSLAAVWRNGKSELIPNGLGEYLTPSVVSVDDDGSILVGAAARDRLISHPERTAAGFKRAMGTSRRYELGGRFFTAEDLSSLVLRRLREDAEAYLGEVVEEAAGAFKVAALPGDLGDGIFFQEGLVLRAVEAVGEVRRFSGDKGGEVEEDAAVDVEEGLCLVHIFLIGHEGISFQIL